jgi:hypothetical protein
MIQYHGSLVVSCLVTESAVLLLPTKSYREEYQIGSLKVLRQIAATALALPHADHEGRLLTPLVEGIISASRWLHLPFRQCSSRQINPGARTRSLHFQMIVTTCEVVDVVRLFTALHDTRFGKPLCPSHRCFAILNFESDCFSVCQ